jgi:hypothetical protein
MNTLQQMYLQQSLPQKATIPAPQVQYNTQQQQQSISPNPAAIQQLLSMLTQPNSTPSTQSNQGTNQSSMYNTNPYLRK